MRPVAPEVRSYRDDPIPVPAPVTTTTLSGHIHSSDASQLREVVRTSILDPYSRFPFLPQH